jgi:WD40 repeat protein
MTGSDSEPRAERLTALLAACDEALAAGASLASSADVPPELQARLERGLACMKLLREVLPPQATPLLPHPPASTAAPPAAAAGFPSSPGRFQTRREGRRSRGAPEQGAYWRTLGIARLLRSFSGHTGQVNTCGFSAEGRVLSSSNMDRTVQLWDVQTGKQLRGISFPTPGNYCVAFSPRGQRALLGADKLSLWDLETNQELRRFEGHTNGLFRVGFSPDGKRALSASWDNTPRLWDLETGKELRQFTGHTNLVLDVAFAPDSNRALSAGSDNTAVRLWDVETGEEIGRFEGHTGAGQAVAFSPDGRLALSGARDATARLWDLETGREIHRFEDQKAAVQAVAFSPDGRHVLLGSGDASLQLWEILSEKGPPKR